MASTMYILAFLVVIFTIALTASGENACLDDWTHYEKDKTCLKVFGEGEDLNWLDARRTCISLGGDLVITHDEDKNNFVSEMFNRTDENFIWIGIRNFAIDGQDFKYVDGSQIGAYNAWDSGEPKDTFKCGAMYVGESHAGKWLDWWCYEKHQFVCSKSSHGLH